jgi:hypothetical protein
MFVLAAPQCVPGLRPLQRILGQPDKKPSQETPEHSWRGGFLSARLTSKTLTAFDARGRSPNVPSGRPSTSGGEARGRFLGLLMRSPQGASSRLRHLPASQIFLHSGDRSRDGVGVIAQRGLQIASVDEFGDQLLRSCLVGRSCNFSHGVLKRPMRPCKAIRRRSKAPTRVDNLSLLGMLSFAGVT